MSVLKKLFGNSDSKDTSNKIMWNGLTKLKQLDTIAEESDAVPVIIFKHSTRCSISRMALKFFEREYTFAEKDVKPYFLDLLAHRDISDEIASRFNVTHQSPQLIVIKNNKAVYHTSHHDINVGNLTANLQTL